MSEESGSIIMSDDQVNNVGEDLFFEESDNTTPRALPPSSKKLPKKSTKAPSVPPKPKGSKGSIL